MPGLRFPIHPYGSGIVRANWAAGFLAVGILVDLAFLRTEASQLGLLTRKLGGEAVALEELSSVEETMEMIGGVQLLILVLSAVAFLMWFHRAYRNLPALGARNLRFTPGWAVGYFFIPILHLFRPYQAAREIWIASDPDVDATAEDGGWRSGPASAVVGWWWLMWILCDLAGMISGFLSVPEDLSILIAASWTGLASTAMGILAAVLAISMIRRIETNQKKKVQRLRDAGAGSPSRIYC